MQTRERERVWEKLKVYVNACQFGRWEQVVSFFVTMAALTDFSTELWTTVNR